MTKILVLSVMLVLCGCGKMPVYNAVVEIDNVGWRVDQPCEFELQVVDSTAQYNLWMDIRTNKRYPWANLFLVYNIQKNNVLIAQDTIEYILMDATGSPIGSGLTSVRENSYALRSNLVFSDTGIYKIGVKHGMRNITLVGVNSVGVRLENAK